MGMVPAVGRLPGAPAQWVIWPVRPPCVMSRRTCARAGVQQLTLYVFSSDNWQRPAAEVSALLELFTSHFRSQADTLARNGIRLSVIGLSLH